MIKSQIPNPKSQTNHNGQNHNVQNQSSVWNLGIVIWCLVIGISPLYAQDNDRLAVLSKQVIEAKSNEELYAPFEQLKDLYLKENKYSEFVDFLKSLSQKNKTIEPFIDYYTALIRYNQLRYLEEKQLWNEYFSQGNAYRDELTLDAQKAVDETTPKEPLNLYARLLLWQFHKAQQDASVEQALTDLMSSVLEYSKSAGDIKPLKDIGDRLLSYGEKGKSRDLYRIYAEKLIASNIKDEELASVASGFYKEGNLELAESIYDVYVDRITGSVAKEKLIPVLIDIAKEFSYKDQGQNDPVYAERIFKKIEELAGKKIFDQQLLYLRAFNLEKAREFVKAKDVYSDLVIAFPETIYADEAIFKMGIISAYVLRDIKEGRNYFEKLIQKKPLSSQGVSGLYQLGLLSQWENDYVLAKDYYNRLIETAAGNYPQMLALTRERLKEIEQVKPMEYALKTFLDVSLKKENSMLDMSRLDLRAHPYKAKKEESVNISTTSYLSPSGCMQIELEYLWSGDSGSKKPSADQPGFDTAYADAGTKVINLVVVSPTGIIDRSLDFVDVH